MNSKLIIFAAPSGAGKSTIAKRILPDYKNLIFSISATTRPIREGEIDGKDYFFLTEDEFKKKIELNEFLEWEKFYDYYYGTLKSFIINTLNNGTSVLLDVDVKGAVNIKKIYPEAITVFIMPPSLEELKNRLLLRKTESEEDLEKRLQRAEMELAYSNQFDYVVINDDLNKAINEVKEIINNNI
jgi:guanylate kinase